VKWKGYTSDDNSWVSVEDCHAEDLISDFWEQHPEQRPKPKKQVTTTKGGKGKLPSLEMASSKSKSRSQYDDAMEVDSDVDPPRKKPRLTKASKDTSSSSAGARDNGKSFSKLELEATESADEHDPAQAQVSASSQPQMVQRFDLMNIRDLRNKIQAVQTVEVNNGKLLYFITLKDGSIGAVSSTYVRKTMPELAIAFFEQHLRWKEDSDRE